MGNYFINKILLILLSISIFAFGLRFYGVLENRSLILILITGYIGIGIMAWINERKYKKEKKEYVEKLKQKKK